MATHIRDNMAIGAVADICDEVCAGLESDPETAGLAPTWTALTAQADALASERQTLERAVRRARAQLTVRDAVWDGVVAAFGRAVNDASAGHHDQAPWTRFFAKVAPSTVQKFGIQREIDTAGAWLLELQRNPDEALAKEWIPKLQTATDALDAGAKQRKTTTNTFGQHQTSITLFIDDLNLEIDRLEGDLKKMFPGDPARVAAYLAPSRPQRAAPVDEPAPPEPTPQDAK